jgi:hypothetical protein
MRRGIVIGVWAVWAAACMPPPVKAVDRWLTAYEQGDLPTMLANTAAADRPWVEKAMATQTSSPTSELSLALPAKPIEHEVLEIESKAEDGAWQIVLVKVTMKNPLPSSSKKVGQNLEGIPETRSQWRKFKAVKEGESYGVKLDLAQVVARSEFAAKFMQLLIEGGLNEAERMLASVPPPPDDPNAQKGADRMQDGLRADLEKRKKLLMAAPPEGAPPPAPASAPAPEGSAP